ncbi:MAG: hypothetical protein K2Q25_04170 [Mycobacteriaceae bacterium]|nr:hypothetical protein [Mycobacteriaceae bacterium]
MFPKSFYIDTPIIDAEQTVLEKTEAALGGGRPPTGGEQYQAVTVELRKVATDMDGACTTATSWQGLAGAAFALEMQAYSSLVTQMATAHVVAAQCLDVQAVAVLDARNGLEEIACQLVMRQIEAHNAALLGNLPASLEIQQAAVDEAEFRRKAILTKLADITANRAAQMNRLGVSMARSAKMLSSTTVDSLADSAVTIETAVLMSLASAVSNCSATLTGLLYGGPWIVTELRLTHGNSVTQGFNAAVAIFEETRDAVLAVALEKVDARAASLSEAVEAYAECDEVCGSELGGSL